MRPHPSSHPSDLFRREGVSVVIPAFNAAAFLGPAIESILRQSYQQFELIVVDDGSTDSTAAIAREYAAEHANIRAYSIPHAGVSNAMNFGIERARNEWVAVMHADDIALPRRLEKQLRAARENPEVVVWGSFAVHISHTGDVMSLSATGPTSVEAFHKRRNACRPILIVHSSAMIRRDALLAVEGYDPVFETSEDLDLFDRLSELGPVVALPEPLVQRRIHASCNTMRTYSRMHLMTRFVSERRRRIEAGGKAIDLDTFLEIDRSRSAGELLKSWIHETSQFYYHRAAIHYGSKRYVPAAAFFLSSTCLNPAYAIKRVWEQLFAFRLVKTHASSLPAFANPTSPAPVYEAA